MQSIVTMKSSKNKLKAIAGLAAAALSGLSATRAHAAAADQFVYYFSGATSTGGGTASLGGVTYDPANTSFYTLGFSGTGQGIRQVQYSSGTWNGGYLVGQTDWLNLLKTDDITNSGAADQLGDSGHIPSGVTAINPTVGGMLLNPASITVGGITYPADTLGIVLESSKTSLSGTVSPTLSKLVYAYDLRAVTYDGAGNYNNSAAAGTRDYNSDGIVGGNDVFYPIVSFANQQALNPGQTSTSNNVARRPVFSTDGQSLYFDDTSAAYGGIYKVNLTGTGNSAITKILTAKNSPTINTEPAVVATSARDLGGGAGSGDQILFMGSADVGNINGVSYVVDTGSSVSTAKVLLTAKQIGAFLDYTGATATVGSITSDSTGGIYIENGNSTYGGIFQYDTQGRLSKVFSESEQRTFEFANNSTYSSSVLQTQILTTTVPYTAGSTTINQLYYRDTGLKAPVGVNIYTPGDFNHDGVINSTDVANLQAHMGLRGATSGYISNTAASTPVNGDYFSYDLNGSFQTTVGSVAVTAVSVDWKDAQIFTQYAGLSYGDVNMDGSVNQTDFNIIGSNYNTDGKTWFQGNIDSVRIAAPDANMVNYADLVTLAANWPVGSAKPTITGYGSAVQTDADRAFAVTANGTISQLIAPNTTGGTINWSTTSAWSNGVPNSAGAVASLLDKPQNDTTMNIDGSYTIGQLNFDSYFSYSLTGTGTLHLQGNNGTTAEINSFAASPVSTVALSLDSPTNISVTYSTDTFAQSGTVSGTGLLSKSGAGTLLLTGSNTYSGGTNIAGGSLQANTTAALPGYNLAGSIKVGSGGTVTVNTGGASEFSASAIAALVNSATFTSGSALGFDTTNAAGTASYTGNLTGSFGITKQGTNTLFLSGTNTNVGITTVTAGTLTAKTPSALPSYAVAASNNVSGGTLAVSVGGAGEWTSANIDTLRADTTFAAGSSIGIDTTDATSGFTYASSYNSATAGLTKLGANTLTLTGTNTYAGATLVLGGTLAVNFSGAGAPTTNIISPTSVLSLGNNGGLAVQGRSGGASSQTFASTTFNAGSATIVETASGSNAILTALGSITRNPGATIDLTLPAGTQSVTNGITTSTSNSSSIIGGYFTVGQTNWAAATSTVLGPLATYTSDTWAAANNTNVTTSSSPTSNTSTNSLRFNSSTAGYTVTLSAVNQLVSGGILVTPAVGANADLITGGTLIGKTGVDLIVNQFDPSATFTIGSVIADATTATGLTKSGTGTLALTAANTYTGTTYVNAGTLQLPAGATLTSPTIAVLSGATLSLGSSTNLPTTAAVSTNGTISVAANTGTTGPASLTLGSLSVGPGGSVSLANPAIHTNRDVLVLSSLTVAGSYGNWLGGINLQGNDLIVHGGSIATVTNLIVTGQSTNTGIYSSTVNADATYLTTLGAIVNNNGAGGLVYGSSTTLGTFDGQSPSLNDTIVKYTYYGDANLDGQVDGSDYTLIDNGFNNQLTGWLNGDFNYDGHIDGSDYTLIDNAFNTQGARISSQLGALTADTTAQIAGSAVPEPASFAMLTLAASGLLLRRRRTV